MILDHQELGTLKLFNHINIYINLENNKIVNQL